MKKIGIRMGILMGVSISLVLSLTGNITSGHFTLMGFLSSFLVSLIVSIVIGLILPMRKVNLAVDRKFGLQEGTLSARAVESLMSDLIYTPVITFLMVTLAWFTASRHGQAPPYVPMLLRSMITSLVVAYLLIFLVTPYFMKLAMKGIEMPPHGEGRPPQAPDEP